MSNQLLQSMIFSVVIMGVLNAYFMQNILKRNGHSFVFAGKNYFNDLKTILQLAKTASDKNDKVKFLLIGWLDIVLTVAFGVLAILFLVYFKL